MLCLVVVKLEVDILIRKIMESRQVIYTYSLIALLMALVLYSGFKPLIDVPEWVLIADAVLSGITLSGLLILLKNIMQYGHFSSLHIRQRLINYSALAILFVVCWLGLEFLILHYFVPEEDWNVLYKTMPIRIAMAFLIYGLSIMFFGKMFQKEIDYIQTDTEETGEGSSLNLNTSTTVVDEIEILERIVVKNGQKIEVVPVSEIIHLQAEGDYVMIHSTKGKFMKEQTMKSLENSLPSDKFVRVHRSNIINIDFIARIELYDKQSQLLKLKNGDQVRASLAGYKLLKKTLGL